MSEILKRRFNIGIGKEATRGTKVVPAVWLKPTSEDYNDEVEVVATERSMGIIEDSDDQEVVKNFSAGVFGGEVFDESFGYFLLAGIGQVSSVETADIGVYAHTFTVLQDALHPTLTVEIKRGDIEQKAYPNVVVESLKISANVNEYVNYEVELRGKEGEAGTATPSYSDENIFLAKHIGVKFADDIAGLTGASNEDIKNFELSILKNIEDKDVLGTDGPADFNVKQFVIEGSFSIDFSSVTIRDYVLNGTKKAMRVEAINTAITLGASSNPTLKIDVAKVKFGEGMVKGGNNDLANIDVSFKGFYSVSDSKSIETVLINEKTSY